MIRFSKKEECLIAFLSGELDHCAAQEMREMMESEIRKTRARRLHLDFSQVSFMDSSGVGLLIGRYRTMAALGGRVTAGGLHPPVDRLFHMAGLHRIIGICEDENAEQSGGKENEK